MNLKGLIRKAAMRLVGGGSTVRAPALLFFMIHKGLSVIEIFGIRGDPVLKIIKNGFAALNSRVKDEEAPPAAAGGTDKMEEQGEKSGNKQ